MESSLILKVRYGMAAFSALELLDCAISCRCRMLLSSCLGSDHNCAEAERSVDSCLMF